jgi:hypothetical protein
MSTDTQPPDWPALVEAWSHLGVAAQARLKDLAEGVDAIISERNTLRRENALLTAELHDAKTRLAVLEPRRTPDQVAQDRWPAWREIRHHNWVDDDEP